MTNSQMHTSHSAQPSLPDGLTTNMKGPIRTKEQWGGAVGQLGFFYCLSLLAKKMELTSIELLSLL